nr:extensin-like [Rhipicephalus microplus]
MSSPYEAYPPPAGVQPFPQPAPVAGGQGQPPPPYYPSPPPTLPTAGVQPAPYPPGYGPPPQPVVVQPSYNPTYVTAPPSAPPVTVIVQQQPGTTTAPTQVVRPPPQQHQSGGSSCHGHGRCRGSRYDGGRRCGRSSGGCARSQAVTTTTTPRRTYRTGQDY